MPLCHWLRAGVLQKQQVARALDVETENKRIWQAVQNCAATVNERAPIKFIAVVIWRTLDREIVNDGVVGHGGPHILVRGVVILAYLDELIERRLQLRPAARVIQHDERLLASASSHVAVVACSTGLDKNQEEVSRYDGRKP